MQHKPDTIALLTYNIIHFPTVPLLTAKNFYKPERLRVIAARLARFDVVCLQEMFRPFSENLDPFLADLRRAGFEYFYIIGLNGLFSTYLIDGGTMVVSKFPIEHAEQKLWPRGVNEDGYLQRGGVYCQVRLPNGALLHAVNVHFQASYNCGDMQFHLDTVCLRQRQFEALKHWMLDIFGRFSVRGTDLFVLCGDFNTDAQRMSPEIRDWLATVPVETADAAGLERLRRSRHLHALLLNYMRLGNRTFGIDDVYLGDHGAFPMTYSMTETDQHGNKVPVETYFTTGIDRMTEDCLDYVFRISPLEFGEERESEGGAKPSAEIVKGSSRLEKFEHKMEGTPLTHLSDHYGISVRIRLG